MFSFFVCLFSINNVFQHQYKDNSDKRSLALYCVFGSQSRHINDRAVNDHSLHWTPCACVFSSAYDWVCVEYLTKKRKVCTVYTTLKSLSCIWYMCLDNEFGTTLVSLQKKKTSFRCSYALEMLQKIIKICNFRVSCDWLYVFLTIQNIYMLDTLNLKVFCSLYYLIIEANFKILMV